MPGICNIPHYTRASRVHSPLCHQKVDNKPTGMCRLRRCPPGIWSMPVNEAPILWPRDGPVQRALSLSEDSEIPWSALCSHTPTTAAFCSVILGYFLLPQLSESTWVKSADTWLCLSPSILPSSFKHVPTVPTVCRPCAWRL